MVRLHPWAKTALSVLLTTTFVFSFAVNIAVQIVSADLLNPNFYAGALEENHIYDRVYTDLLADPELRKVTTRLLGNFEIKTEYSRQAYSYTVSSLRLILPPEVIRSAVEKILEELTAYLAGKRARLDANLNLSQFINDPHLQDKIMVVVQAAETELMAQVRSQGLFLQSESVLDRLNVANLYVQLEIYVRNLMAGIIEEPPASLALFPIDKLSDQQKRLVANVLLAPVADRVSADTRLQVETALSANDLPGALAIVSSQLAEAHTGEAIASLRQELKNGSLSGVNSLAALANETGDTVVAELNSTRTLIRVFPHDLTLPAIAVMGITLIGLVQLHAKQRRQGLRITGEILVFASLCVILGWAILEHMVSMPYARLTVDIKNNNFPPALRRMLSDTLASLKTGLRVSVWFRVFVPLLLGVGLIAVSFVPRVFDSLRVILERLSGNWRVSLAAVGVVLLVVLAVANWLMSGSRLPAAEHIRCNGYAELCDRPFDQVVFAATHNAMSASELGWIWPNQDGDITLQLEAGVRALLIDTHYGDTPEEINAYLVRIPASVRPVLRQVIDEADSQVKGRGTFLCHNLCSLGATPLVDGLADIRQFMDEHPYEVIVLIIQDGITPQDTAQAFEDSGLIYYVYTHEPETAWPTLGEMIDRNERLVVFAESSGPPPAWYHYVWDYVQETAYSFTTPQDFTCAPNRGGTGKPLFLLNHWIAQRSPDRVDATYVNSFDFLLNRAQTCARERGQIPNFVAVDFFSIGDLFAVVDRLNGVS